MLPQVQCCWATNYYKTGVHIEIPMKILFWTGQNEKLYYSNVAISFPVITYRWESTVLYFTSRCQENGRCSYPIVGNNDKKYTNLRYQTGLAQPIPLKNMRSSVGSILPNWMEKQSKCSKPPAPWYCCLNEIPYVPWLNDMFFFYDFFWSSICHPSHNGNSPSPNYWLDNPASRAKRHPGECGSIPLADCRFLSSTKRWITHIKCREHGVYSC